MKYFKQVMALADRFAQQAYSAQAADIQDVLTSAGFFKPETNAAVGQILDALKIETGVPVVITITVMPGFKITYHATVGAIDGKMSPQNVKTAESLKKALTARYSIGMTNALKAFKNKAGQPLNVENDVTCGWFTF